MQESEREVVQAEISSLDKIPQKQFVNPGSLLDFYENELRYAALHWLAEQNPVQKAAGVRHLAQRCTAGNVDLDTEAKLVTALRIPGSPDKPRLVSPQSVKQRSMHTLEGRAAMIHALIHIEFTAINLALDATWRFPGMPHDFYTDWLRVADEEALHFTLLSEHLQTLGYAYGDFPAHNGLWELAEKTRHDVLARMALLPRTMEARGLDVTPVMRAKLIQAGDTAIGPIMDIILRDEIGHVAIGNHWFNYLCSQRGLDPVEIYPALLEEHRPPPLRPPFNLEARRAAGFSDKELSEFELNQNSTAQASDRGL